MNLIKHSLRRILIRPVTWLANRFSSAPKREDVFASLTKIYEQSLDQPEKKSGSMFSFDPKKQPVIIFSDQHKGAKDGSDDFALAEKNYITALDYYNKHNFYYVNLGDCEELWENTVFSVMKHNKLSLEKEKLFVDRNVYTKIVGNHDLFWGNDPFAQQYIKSIYGKELKIFEGIVLRVQLETKYVDVFCTHGHQGDAQSDGNAFSKWFVSYIWGPLQSFLKINTNSPSSNVQLKTLHNSIMYDWVYDKPQCILITGHTHQPVFKSLTHLERLYLKLEDAKEKNDKAVIDRLQSEIPRRKLEYGVVSHSYRNMNPSYFNTGCCCFDDGTITGIELQDGFIRLVKWSYINGIPARIVAEETSLYELLPFI